MGNDKRKLVLAVCWGNIQRSPTAAFLINREIKKRGLENKYYCLSRGILGSAGLPPPKHPNFTFYKEEYEAAEPHLRNLEIDLSTHIAQPIDRETIERADIILAMDKKILTDPVGGLFVQFPECKEKVHLFSELLGGDFEVQDLDTVTESERHKLTINMLDRTVREGFPTLLSFTDLA
ncbi:MAG: hypothetical protein HYU80_03000 [Candidatus Blackburnbacteria bacterium]|nr:hypothetical protein [Candidatus Blackburnbacteria bacterium]